MEESMNWWNWPQVYNTVKYEQNGRIDEYYKHLANKILQISSSNFNSSNELGLSWLLVRL